MSFITSFFTKRAKTPIETRDYGRVYLLLSALLFIGTMWAVVDEVLTRRPWKEYQQEYHELSLQKWQEAYAEAVANFDSSALQALQIEYAEAEEKFKNPEYRSLVPELSQIDNELLDANRDFTFAKSRSDEAYYFWKKSIHEGKEDEDSKSKVQEYADQISKFNTRVETLESRKAEISESLDRYNQPLKQVRSKINGLYVSIEKAKDKIDHIQSSSILINQVILDNFDRSNFGIPKARVDRCQTCHAGWNDDMMEGEGVPLQFRKHPLPELLKIHNPENFGCTPCHQGQGPALTEGFAHGSEDHYWEWPLLSGNEAYASCNKCHNEELFVKFGGVLNKAKTILAESGCYGCHEIKGYTDLPKIGPELDQLPAKTSADWIYRWVRNPKDYNAHTRMPDFRLSNDEAEAITAYLWNAGKQGPFKTTKGISAGGNANRGKELVETIGCKGCHVVGEDTRMRDARQLSFDIAPELTRVGSKIDPDWTFEWVRNPRHFRPETRMPSLRLTDQEARDVVAYLITLKDERRFEEKKLDLISGAKIKRGDKLIREYGCHGCHAIQGMEKEGRVSVALSNIGRKRVDEIDFGDTKVPHTWDDWIFNKLKDSRMYATDRIISKMPVFALADSEIVILRTLLRSLTKEAPEQHYQHAIDKRQQQLNVGRHFTLNYNCVQCHVVEEVGGYIKATLDDEGFAPPLLRPEGAKVQEGWLHGFLKSPTVIRPWLKIRMPTFSLTDDEIAKITKYFLAIHQKEFELRDYKLTEKYPKFLSAGKILFEEFQCLSCHTTGKIPEGKTPGDLAPNLALASGRLKPDWILDWLADPQKIQEGTRMPSYFPDMQSPDPDILGGNSMDQIQALRDYVFSIGQQKQP